MRKRFTLLLGILCCSLLSTGCVSRRIIKEVANTIEKSNTGGPSGKRGPEYDVLHEGAVLHAETFDLEIESASLMTTFEEISPGDESWRYLIVNMNIQNMFADAATIQLNANDFKMTWEELDGYTIDPEKSYYFYSDLLADGSDQIKLFKNGERTGDLIYIVPGGVDSFQLVYNDKALPFEASEAEDSSSSDSYYDDYYGGYDDYYGDDYYGDDYYDYYDYYGDFFSDWGNYGWNDGVEYGEPDTTVRTQDVMVTDYFTMTVNSSTIVEEFEDQKPSDEVQRYLIVNITVENTYTSLGAITMSYYDFELKWNGLESGGVYPESNTFTDQLPDSYSIFYGDSRTGNLVFLVSEKLHGFSLEYYDENGTYNVSFDTEGEAQL